MQHEKIFKREEGTNIKVTAYLHQSKIRTWVYRWDRIRSDWYKTTEINATPEEHHQTKLELWEKLKPTL